MKADTLSCTYYVSEDIKIPDASSFSQLQGNNNSLLLDGRFNSIPLKTEIMQSSGIKIVIEATKVTRREVSSSFLLPPSYSLK